MKKSYSVILVIPCYNEAKRLELPTYKAFLADHPDFFILFVNDGSRDDTQSVLDAAGIALDNYASIQLDKNNGKGEAVRKGIAYCLNRFDFEYIGYTDADLSTPLEEFLFFRNELKKNPELRVVMGSRVQMLGKNIRRNLFRHWFSRIIATAICKVLDEPVYDTQCGAKLFVRQTAEELFREKFISRWLFDVEWLARYKKMHGSEMFRKTILEYPVSRWTEMPDSKIRYHYFFRMIGNLFKIRKHYFRKK